MENRLRHFLFTVIDEDSENCGEDFIVGAEDIAAAINIAMSYFDAIQYSYELTEEEAEASGLDEY